MPNIPSPLASPIDEGEYRMAGPSSARGDFTRNGWTSVPSTLHFQDAVVETVVTQVTRTTTSFAPLKLPSLPLPEAITLPTHLSKEDYPLAHAPVPDEMKWFSMNVGDQPVVISEDSPSESTDLEDGRGWRRTMPVPTTGKGKGRGRMNLIQALTPGWRGNDDRKRAHQTLEAFEQTPGSPSTSRQREDLGARAYPSPPRKKIRSTQKPTAGAPLSPLPSPELESPPPPASIPLGPGYELATLYSLPTMMTHFDGLPDQLQQHVLTHMLRRSRMPTIQRIANFASSAIRRDLIGCLPRELSVQILKYVDAKTLARSTRVCKKWRHIIDGDRSVWKEKLIEDQLYCGKGVEEAEEAVVEARFRVLDEMPSRSLLMKTAATSRANSTTRITEIPHILPADRSVPLKHVYRRRYQTQDNWFNQRPVHNSFPGQGTTVVTCLQFDREKIVSASDDQSINVYSTSTGRLRKKLEGHEGGVWALQYRGDTLVTGSTDRSVRVWDLRTLQHTHTFTGHTSTVRCLQIVEPVLDEKTGKYYPSYPVIVTGSRDHSLRVWKLPMRGEPAVHKWGYNDKGESVRVLVKPEENPYHILALMGHTDAIRALACHGRICISGAYDSTVRVWDIVQGKCLHKLTGHEQKVYSVVYDKYRNRCASGSMDNTVKIWDVETGTCLYTLMGHTSLVGLLGLSPSHLVSAAADSSLRIWNAEDTELQHVLRNHGGAITCFRHDEHKVVSGSDGIIKLWDIRRGKWIRDLVIGVNSVWQLGIKDNLLVAASQRNGSTVFDVFDFGKLNHPSGVDDDNLDETHWELKYPRESIANEMYRKGYRHEGNIPGEVYDPYAVEEFDDDDPSHQWTRADEYAVVVEESDGGSNYDEFGEPVPWPFDRLPERATIQCKARPILINARPKAKAKAKSKEKDKTARRSTRIARKSSDLPESLSRADGETFDLSTSRPEKGGYFKMPFGGNGGSTSSNSPNKAGSSSKVKFTVKDKDPKGKGKAKMKPIATGSRAGPSTSKSRLNHNARVTRSRSGPGASASTSPARVTRTSSAGQLTSSGLRKRSYAPVFDDEDDEEVEEELELDEADAPRLRTRRLSDNEEDEEDMESSGRIPWSVSDYGDEGERMSDGVD